MCNKAILGNGGALKSVPDCYKNQEMCNKAVDNVLEFVRECFMTLKICDKAVNTDPSTIKFFPKCFMTQEMYDKTVRICFLHSILFLINIKPKKCVIVLFLKILFYGILSDKYKTQKICDEADINSLVSWKFVSDWVVTNKILYTDENILYFNEDPDNVFSCCECEF